MSNCFYRSPFRHLFRAGLPLLLSSAAQALTLTDPALVTGSGSIDPSGSREITLSAPGSTAKATLEALPGFAVVRTFTGFATGTNELSFADPLRSDVQISFSGTGNGTSGGELSNSTFVTSGTSGVRVVSSDKAGAHTVIQTIDFGSWNGTTFDSTLNPVSAAGFTLAGQAVNFERVDSISASFLSDGGDVLSTLTVSGTSLAGSNQGIYFGWQSPGSDRIGSVVITVNINAEVGTQGQVILGFDDFGYTAIPEPSTYALLLGAVVLAACLRARCK